MAWWTFYVYHQNLHLKYQTSFALLKNHQGVLCIIQVLIVICFGAISVSNFVVFIISSISTRYLFTLTDDDKNNEFTCRYCSQTNCC